MSFDPYKGVRDFYPEDERVQKYIFAAMRRAVESFGYEEMNASVLEPTDLYAAKTSEEIVSQQTYTFLDRGERSVTLRPEMTPTVARMVAAKRRELGFPLRWYSIQNFFRYERPQRGRLREFWQLNADLFGVSGIEADVEIITMASQIMKELGANKSDFEIQVSDRKLFDILEIHLGISKEEKRNLIRILDKNGGKTDSELKKELEKAEYSELVINEILKLKNKDLTGSSPDTINLAFLQEKLGDRGIRIKYNPMLARGFDYYTGIVFEVFDTHKDNTRSMFGGGRYDNLVGQYGKESVPAVGFAMGDVIARDFLETHGLLPKLSSSAHLYLAPVSEKNADEAAKLAETLRSGGLRVALGMGHEKIGDHIKAASKLGILFFAAFGEKEKEAGALSVKELETGEEKTLPFADVCRYIGKL